MPYSPYPLGFSAPENVLSYHHVVDEVSDRLVRSCELGWIRSQRGAPTASSILDLASAGLGFDFWLEGRTLQKLGLAETISGDIFLLVNQGRRFWESR